MRTIKNLVFAGACILLAASLPPAGSHTSDGGGPITGANIALHTITGGLLTNNLAVPHEVLALNPNAKAGLLPRWETDDTVSALNDAQMYCTPFFAHEDEELSAINFMTKNAINTPANYWAAIYLQSDLSLKASSVDSTTTAWGANEVRQFTFSSAYTPATDAVHMACIMINATGNPVLKGHALSNVAIAVGTGVGNYNAGLAGSAPDPAVLSAEAVDILWFELE